MAKEGLPIWALTPVNEPHGNQGTWESMEMSPAEQAAYVAVLGDTVEKHGLETKILVYDQNRKGMNEFADGVFSDAEAARHAWGTAVHWYDSTFRVYEDELEALHTAWPDRPIVQTEGCIDNVFSHGEFKGPGAPTPWWRNDPWFWDKVATDWGWDWAEDPEVDHPRYAAAFRYARDLVGGLSHWLSGWVDWNLALTRRGGPNHVENFCLAPILVDGPTVYLTPLFHILAQVSSHTRPGAVVVETEAVQPKGLWSVALVNPDGSRVVHVFNEAAKAQALSLVWGETKLAVEIPSAALVTVVLD
jgi:glucosylceramidase